MTNHSRSLRLLASGWLIAIPLRPNILDDFKSCVERTNTPALASRLAEMTATKTAPLGCHLPSKLTY